MDELKDLFCELYFCLIRKLVCKPAFTVPCFNEKGYLSVSTHWRLNFHLAVFMTLSVFIFKSQFKPLSLTVGEIHKKLKSGLKINFGIKTCLYNSAVNRVSPNTGAENRKKVFNTLGKQFMMDSEYRNFVNLINATNLPWKCHAFVYTKRILIAFIFLLQDYQSNKLQGEFNFGVTWLFFVSYTECTNIHDLKPSAVKRSMSCVV